MNIKRIILSENSLNNSKTQNILMTEFISISTKHTLYREEVDQMWPRILVHCGRMDSRGTGELRRKMTKHYPDYSKFPGNLL